MAYQGISPYIYQQNNLTNVQLIDDISSQFNGSTTTFTMTSGGDTFHAVASRSIFIVLGGIVQEPDVDYTTTGDEITFTTAPVSGLSFAGRKIYGLNKIDGINDGLVTPSKLSLGGPSWDTNGNLSVSGNITQTGDTNNIIINTDTPTVRPTLDLNFARDKRLDSKITFTRDSIGTYTDDSGLVKTAVNNVPRFDHDPITNESLGLLIEESRTNKLPYSVDFSNAAWTKINGGTGSAPTVTANYATSPDGTNTASRIQASLGNGTTSSDYSLVRDPITTDGSDHTWSVWLKSNTTSNQTVILSWYHPDQPVTVTPTWQRFSLTKQQAGFEADIGMRGDATNITRSVDILAWGGQLEDGSFATSYIPTSGSTVTRSADNLDILYNQFYNDSLTYDYASTFYAEAKVFKANQTSMIVEGYIGSSLKDFSLNTMNGAKMQYVHRYTATNSYDNDTANNTVADNVFFKTAMSYTGTDGGLHGTINGRDPILGEDDLGSTASGGDTMAIGRRGSNNTLYLNGNLKRLIYYPVKLTSNQLQNLTK